MPDPSQTAPGRDGPAPFREEDTAPPRGTDLPPGPGTSPDPVARLAADIRARDSELVELRAALQALEAELAALRGSTSWRLTAPLRALVRLLRGR